MENIIRYQSYQRVIDRILWLRQTGFDKLNHRYIKLVTGFNKLVSTSSTTVSRPNHHVNKTLCLCAYVPMCLFLLLSNNCYAQKINSQLDRGYSSNNNIWNYYHNPSGISGVEELSGGFSYANSYLIKQLGRKTATICFPVDNTVFAAGISSDGCSLYHINEFSLGCAKMLTERFSAGIKLNYQYDKFQDNQTPSLSVLSFDIGMNANINKNLNIAAKVSNPQPIRLNDDKTTKYPATIEADLEYVFNEKTRLIVESKKDIAFKPSFETSIIHQLNNKIQLFSSFRPQPFSHSIGFSLCLKSSKINVEVERHVVLGISTMVGFNTLFIN